MHGDGDEDVDDDANLELDVAAPQLIGVCMCVLFCASGVLLFVLERCCR